MSRRVGVNAALGLLLLAATPVAGQSFRYLAFGDSITEGIDRWDELHLGGYPARLSTALGCNGSNCEVDNEGLGGETSGEGLTRIDGVLAAKRYDVMLLMEGTNDLRGGNPISVETVEFNLDAIAGKAAAKGVETVHIAPPHFHPNVAWWANDPMQQGLGNTALDNLRLALQDLAAATGRESLSMFLMLCQGNDEHGHNESQCFNKDVPKGPIATQHFYWPACDPGDPDSLPDPILFPDFDPLDPVTGCDRTGHPNASGFTMLVDFRILPRIRDDRDPPGAPTAVSPTGDVGGFPTFVWDRENPGVSERTLARWYQIVVEDAGTTVASDWVEAAAHCDASTCSYVLPTALPGRLLTWKVQGRNVAGRSAYSAALAIRPYPVPPVAPAASAPAGDYYDAAGKDFTYAWTSVAEATGYDVQVRDGGGALVIDVSVTAAGACVGSSCTLKTGITLGQGDYTWQVRGTNPAGAGAWSAALAMSVYTAAPAAPQTLHPDNTTRWYRPLYSTRPLLTWVPSAGATGYDIQVDAVTVASVGTSACVGTRCSLRLGSDLVVGPHDWRVRGTSPLGNGAYSPAPQFVLQFCGNNPLVLPALIPDDPGHDRVYEACLGVATPLGGSTIEPGSPVILHSRDVVILGNGSSVGGTLVILIDP